MGRDPTRRHVLPLGTQLIIGPGFPGPATVLRQPPSVSHCAVPDLAFWPEAEGLHEIPGERTGRGVAPDHLPARGTGG
jgi:hypothetical protein